MYVRTYYLHTYCNLHKLCDTCKVAHEFVAISVDTFHTAGTYILTYLLVTLLWKLLA